MPKTVLVTGASRGIGFCIAETFARKGYRVFATYCNTTTTLLPLAEQLRLEGVSLTPIYCDVTSESAVSALFDEIDTVDILINNAGIAQFSLLSDITLSDWETMIKTNLTSVFLCSKAASKGMISQKFGRIINISSVWGVCGASCESHYSAAKAGVIGLTRALAKELGPSNITVNCIAPGVIETEMNARLSQEDLAALCDETPLGRVGKPQDVANAALYLAEADFVTGEVLNVGGGFGF